MKRLFSKAKNKIATETSYNVGRKVLLSLSLLLMVTVGVVLYSPNAYAYSADDYTYLLGTDGTMSSPNSTLANNSTSDGQLTTEISGTSINSNYYYADDGTVYKMLYYVWQETKGDEVSGAPVAVYAPLSSLSIKSDTGTAYYENGNSYSYYNIYSFAPSWNNTGNTTFISQNTYTSDNEYYSLYQMVANGTITNTGGTDAYYKYDQINTDKYYSLSEVQTVNVIYKFEDGSQYSFDDIKLSDYYTYYKDVVNASELKYDLYAEGPQKITTFITSEGEVVEVDSPAWKSEYETSYYDKTSKLIYIWQADCRYFFAYSIKDLETLKYVSASDIKALNSEDTQESIVYLTNTNDIVVKVLKNKTLIETSYQLVQTSTESTTVYLEDKSGFVDSNVSTSTGAVSTVFSNISSAPNAYDVTNTYYFDYYSSELQYLYETEYAQQVYNYNEISTDYTDSYTDTYKLEHTASGRGTNVSTKAIVLPTTLVAYESGKIYYTVENYYNVYEFDKANVQNSTTNITTISSEDTDAENGTYYTKSQDYQTILITDPVSNVSSYVPLYLYSNNKNGYKEQIETDFTKRNYYTITDTYTYTTNTFTNKTEYKVDNDFTGKSDEEINKELTTQLANKDEFSYSIKTKDGKQLGAATGNTYALYTGTGDANEKGQRYYYDGIEADENNDNYYLTGNSHIGYTNTAKLVENVEAGKTGLVETGREGSQWYQSFKTTERYLFLEIKYDSGYSRTLRLALPLNRLGATVNFPMNTSISKGIAEKNVIPYFSTLTEFLYTKVINDVCYWRARGYRVLNWKNEREDLSDNELGAYQSTIDLVSSKKHSKKYGYINGGYDVKISDYYVAYYDLGAYNSGRYVTEYPTTNLTQYGGTVKINNTDYTKQVTEYKKAEVLHYKATLTEYNVVPSIDYTTVTVKKSKGSEAYYDTRYFKPGSTTSYTISGTKLIVATAIPEKTTGSVYDGNETTTVVKRYGKDETTKIKFYSYKNHITTEEVKNHILINVESVFNQMSNYVVRNDSILANAGQHYYFGDNTELEKFKEAIQGFNKNATVEIKEENADKIKTYKVTVSIPYGKTENGETNFISNTIILYRRANLKYYSWEKTNTSAVTTTVTNESTVEKRNMASTPVSESEGLKQASSTLPNSVYVENAEQDNTKVGINSTYYKNYSKNYNIVRNKFVSAVNSSTTIKLYNISTEYGITSAEDFITANGKSYSGNLSSATGATTTLEKYNSTSTGKVYRVLNQPELYDTKNYILVDNKKIPVYTEPISISKTITFEKINSQSEDPNNSNSRYYYTKVSGLSEFTNKLCNTNGLSTECYSYVKATKDSVVSYYTATKNVTRFNYSSSLNTVNYGTNSGNLTKNNDTVEYGEYSNITVASNGHMTSGDYSVTNPSVFTTTSLNLFNQASWFKDVKETGVIKNIENGYYKFTNSTNRNVTLYLNSGIYGFLNTTNYTITYTNASGNRISTTQSGNVTITIPANSTFMMKDVTVSNSGNKTYTTYVDLAAGTTTNEEKFAIASNIKRRNSYVSLNDFKNDVNYSKFSDLLGSLEITSTITGYEGAPSVNDAKSLLLYANTNEIDTTKILYTMTYKKGNETKALAENILFADFEEEYLSDDETYKFVYSDMKKGLQFLRKRNYESSVTSASRYVLQSANQIDTIDSSNNVDIVDANGAYMNYQKDPSSGKSYAINSVYGTKLALEAYANSHIDTLYGNYKYYYDGNVFYRINEGGKTYYQFKVYTDSNKSATVITNGLHKKLDSGYSDILLHTTSGKYYNDTEEITKETYDEIVAKFGIETYETAFLNSLSTSKENTYSFSNGKIYVNGEEYTGIYNAFLIPEYASVTKDITYKYGTYRLVKNESGQEFSEYSLHNIVGYFKQQSLDVNVLYGSNGSVTYQAIRTTPNGEEELNIFSRDNYYYIETDGSLYMTLDGYYTNDYDSSNISFRNISQFVTNTNLRDNTYTYGNKSTKIYEAFVIQEIAGQKRYKLYNNVQKSVAIKDADDVYILDMGQYNSNKLSSTETYRLRWGSGLPNTSRLYGYYPNQSFTYELKDTNQQTELNQFIWSNGKMFELQTIVRDDIQYDFKKDILDLKKRLIYLAKNFNFLNMDPVSVTSQTFGTIVNGEPSAFASGWETFWGTFWGAGDGWTTQVIGSKQYSADIKTKWIVGYKDNMSYILYDYALKVGYTASEARKLTDAVVNNESMMYTLCYQMETLAEYYKELVSDLKLENTLIRSDNYFHYLIDDENLSQSIYNRFTDFDCIMIDMNKFESLLTMVFNYQEDTENRTYGSSYVILNSGSERLIYQEVKYTTSQNQIAKNVVQKYVRTDDGFAFDNGQEYTLQDVFDGNERNFYKYDVTNQVAGTIGTRESLYRMTGYYYASWVTSPSFMHYYNFRESLQGNANILKMTNQYDYAFVSDGETLRESSQWNQRNVGITKTFANTAREYVNYYQTRLNSYSDNTATVNSYKLANEISDFTLSVTTTNPDTGITTTLNQVLNPIYQNDMYYLDGSQYIKVTTESFGKNTCYIVNGQTYCGIMEMFQGRILYVENILDTASVGDYIYGFMPSTTAYYYSKTKVERLEIAMGATTNALSIEHSSDRYFLDPSISTNFHLIVDKNNNGTDKYYMPTIASADIRGNEKSTIDVEINKNVKHKIAEVQTINESFWSLGLAFAPTSTSEICGELYSLFGNGWIDVNTGKYARYEAATPITTGLQKKSIYNLTYDLSSINENVDERGNIDLLDSQIEYFSNDLSFVNRSGTFYLETSGGVYELTNDFMNNYKIGYDDRNAIWIGNLYSLAVNMKGKTVDELKVFVYPSSPSEGNLGYIKSLYRIYSQESTVNIANEEYYQKYILKDKGSLVTFDNLAKFGDIYKLTNGSETQVDTDYNDNKTSYHFSMKLNQKVGFIYQLSYVSTNGTCGTNFYLNQANGITTCYYNGVDTENFVTTNTILQSVDLEKKSDTLVKYNIAYNFKNDKLDITNLVGSADYKLEIYNIFGQKQQEMKFSTGEDLTWNPYGTFFQDSENSEYLSEYAPTGYVSGDKLLKSTHISSTLKQCIFSNGDDKYCTEANGTKYYLSETIRMRMEYSIDTIQTVKLRFYSGTNIGVDGAIANMKVQMTNVQTGVTVETPIQNGYLNITLTPDMKKALMTYMEKYPNSSNTNEISSNAIQQFIQQEIFKKYTFAFEGIPSTIQKNEKLQIIATVQYESDRMFLDLNQNGILDKGTVEGNYGYKGFNGEPVNNELQVSYNPSDSVGSFTFNKEFTFELNEGNYDNWFNIQLPKTYGEIETYNLDFMLVYVPGASGYKYVLFAYTPDGKPLITG